MQGTIVITTRSPVVEVASKSSTKACHPSYLLGYLVMNSTRNSHIVYFEKYVPMCFDFYIHGKLRNWIVISYPIYLLTFTKKMCQLLYVVVVLANCPYKLLYRKNVKLYIKCNKT